MSWRSRLLGCLVLCGCSSGGDTDRDEGPSVADLVEELRIDGYAEELAPIDDLLAGPDGEIVVEQRQDSQIRYYDSTGLLMGTFGRPGQGPGELSGLNGIGVRADTLWAWDRSLSRMSLVSWGRELLRTFVLERPIRAALIELPELPNWASPLPRGIRGDGNLIVEFQVLSGLELPEPYANQVVLGAVTPEGRLEAILARVPHGGPIAYSTESGGGGIPYPLRNAAQVAVSGDGSRIAGAMTSLQGDGADSVLVTIWDSDGATVWSRSVPFEPVPLPATVVDSVFDIMRGFPPRFQEAFREQVRPPPVYPPLRGLLLGRDHSVWIEMMVRDGGRTYRVLTASGALMGTVPVSEGSRIAVAAMDRIWMIEQDEVGVESIVRYSVTWN